MKMLAIAMLAASAVAASEKLQHASLRVSLEKTVTVDEKDGIIKNAAIMTVGTAHGVGFAGYMLDKTSLAQLCDLINAEEEGVKVHFRHPKRDEDGVPEDQLGEMVGRLKNCRIEGETLRGDIFLGEYAKKLPVLGDAWAYLTSVAKEDPTAIGLSAVFSYDVEPITRGGSVDALAARIKKVFQVDFVGHPASNPKGLLQATPAEGETASIDVDSVDLTPTARTLLQAAVTACQTSTADCQALLTSVAAFTPSTAAMAALITAADKLADSAFAATVAARACVDHCNLIPMGAASDRDTSELATVCIRHAALCRSMLTSASSAIDSMAWGTSKLATACAGALRPCRTAADTLYQLQDAVGPLTSTVSAYLAQKNVEADRRAMLRG